MPFSLSSVPTSAPPLSPRALEASKAIIRGHLPKKAIEKRPIWHPVTTFNPFSKLKLSNEDNLRMKEKYYKKITKGIMPVSDHKKGFYHIISALPAAGKTTVMNSLKKSDPSTITIERDDMVMLHPHVKEAMKHDPAKWASKLRDLEEIDVYFNDPMLERFMKDRYNIAQGVTRDMNEHLDKAQKNNYNADIHLVLAPIRTIKLRAMQRFLTAAPESGDKRLTFSNQYDHPIEGYSALQDKYIKELFEKRPKQAVSVIYETSDSCQKQEATIHSYDQYKQVLNHVNKLPEKKERRRKFNEDVRNLREMFYEKYPMPTKEMPENYRRGALELLREIPE